MSGNSKNRFNADMNGKKIELRTVIQNISDKKARQIKFKMWIKHSDGSIATDSSGNPLQTVQTFDVPVWNDKANFWPLGALDHIKSDFNSGLKSCSLIYQIPSDAQLKSGDTVAFQVLDENGNVLADDNTETQRYTTVSIQYKFEDGSEIPNTAGGTFTVPYGTKLDLTPAKSLYGYEFVKADGLNKPIVSDGTVVTYYYKNKNEEHTHNLTLVAAKAATCTAAGNSAYYTCDGCDKWFADATGSVEITDKTSVKIPATGHTAGTEWKSDDTNHWHECTVAGCGVIIESTKSAHTAGEWIVDTPATATTAGTKHKECTVCHRVLETQTIPSMGTELKIIAVDNQIYDKASGSDVTITCNGDFAKFTGIKVDGSVVDSSNYTAVSGSTVLTLKASYLGTLTDGSHTITFVYTDGEANANLTVRTAGSEHIHDYGTEWKSNADNHWHECNCGDKKDEAAHSFKWVVDKEATATKKGSKHEECKTCGYKRPAVEIPATGTTTAPTDTTKPNDTTKPGNTNGSEKSPQTGDNSNIFLWFALLFVSVAGVTGITVYNKKKKEHAE